MKEKPRCKNCGDETTFPKTAVAGRVTKGWCVPCYTTWFKYAPRNGGEHWTDEKDMYRRDPFKGSHLPERGE